MAFRFGFSGLRAREGCNEQRSLVAVSCTHRNALAALGTTARKNCSSALRFHAATKPVGLRAAAAIRLKCALRHGSALLKISSMKMGAVYRAEKYSVQQFLSISHHIDIRKIRGQRPLFHKPWCNSK